MVDSFVVEGEGEVSAALPEAEATIDLELEEGRYLFFCGVPNPDEISHAVFGMQAEVEIGSNSGA